MLTVKLLSRIAPKRNAALWQPLLPSPTAFGVHFTFDPDARDYDYLVVYEDLTFLPDDTRSNRVERLACAPLNTLFITTEPPSIKIYGHHFLRQFGHVLTKQPIAHPGHIDRTPPLRPYYGRPLDERGRFLSYAELSAPRTGKREAVSTVCSDKTMTPALKARYDFVMRLRAESELDVFGRGIQLISEKSEAIDPYAYHIAIENHVAPGHWTEKISDAYLGEALPFYHGDPKIADAFPSDAVISIDIGDFDAARSRMEQVVRDREYAKRLPAIREAKRRVLVEHNTLRVAADIALRTHQSGKPSGEIMGRHAFRRAHPVLATSDAIRQARG